MTTEKLKALKILSNSLFYIKKNYYSDDKLINLQLDTQEDHEGLTLILVVYVDGYFCDSSQLIHIKGKDTKSYREINELKKYFSKVINKNYYNL